MSQVRGIPEPALDAESLLATVAALKESVESDAQKIRGRDTPQVDQERVERQLAAKEALDARAATDAAVKARDKVIDDLSVKLRNERNRTTALEQKLHTPITGVYARLDALEGAP